MIFDEYPNLENDYVILRKMNIKDEARLIKMKQEKEIYKTEPSFLPELLSKDAKTFILEDCDRLFNDHNTIILGIYLKKEPDVFIGILELYGYDPERNKISIGYRLMKEYWHKLIATSAVGLIKDYLLNDMKLDRLTAHILIDNIGSIKTVLNNGFVQRFEPHEEDWGLDKPVIANKYVVYIK